MGQGHKILARVGLGQPFLVWVRKISTKNPKFLIFPFGSKKSLWVMSKVPGSNTGQPLIYCGSKVSLGRVELDQGSSLAMGVRVAKW